MDGVTLITTQRTLQFKLAVKVAVSKVLKIDQSAVVVYSTSVSSRRRLMEVSDSRKLHGAQAGVCAVYIVTMPGTTTTALATTLSMATANISSTLLTYSFTGTTIREATVVLGNPSKSTTTTGSKSSASSGTRSHVAVMICALAVVIMQSVLL